jgi:hypothetical protein
MERRALPLLLLFACNAAPDRILEPPPPDPETPASHDYEAKLQPYATCFAAGAECGTESETGCCEGLFCSTDLGSYGPGACLAPQANGSFCVEDLHCASGRCFNYTCADANCRDQGAECYDDPNACCPGLFCLQDTGAYGVAACAPPQPAGAFCLDNAACASYQCLDNTCQ